MTETVQKIVQPDFRRAELRVKIKSLAAEARLIRLEERKQKACIERSKASVTHPGEHVEQHRAVRAQLYYHRIQVVRLESRYAQLAYAYLRGKAYRAIEQNGKPHHLNFPKLRTLIVNFGPPVVGPTCEEVMVWALLP